MKLKLPLGASLATNAPVVNYHDLMRISAIAHGIAERYVFETTAIKQLLDYDTAPIRLSVTTTGEWASRRKIFRFVSADGGRWLEVIVTDVGSHSHARRLMQSIEHDVGNRILLEGEYDRD